MTSGCFPLPDPFPGLFLWNSWTQTGLTYGEYAAVWWHEARRLHCTGSSIVWDWIWERRDLKLTELRAAAREYPAPNYRTLRRIGRLSGSKVGHTAEIYRLLELDEDLTDREAAKERAAVESYRKRTEFDPW